MNPMALTRTFQSMAGTVGIDVLSWNQAIRDFVDIHKEVFGDGRADERTQTLVQKMDELVASRIGGA